MSKSKTERKKKRKREKSSRSLLASEDRDLDNTEVQVEDIQKRIKIDENCIEKKKKKKKRRKKNACEGPQTLGKRDSTTHSIDPSATVIPTPVQQQEQSENTAKDSEVSSNKLPNKTKKKKKKKSRNSSGGSLDKIRNDDENSGDTIGSKRGEVADIETGDEIVLEGSMVMDVLVLIDRANAKVYSATEELSENGERKQIGSLDGNGQVVLFQKTEERRENGKIQFALL